jgi:hypothetical protein
MLQTVTKLDRLVINLCIDRPKILHESALRREMVPVSICAGALAETAFAG